jgi:hypothetical protein
MVSQRILYGALAIAFLTTSFISLKAEAKARYRPYPLAAVRSAPPARGMNESMSHWWIHFAPMELEGDGEELSQTEWQWTSSAKRQKIRGPEMRQNSVDNEGNVAMEIEPEFLSSSRGRSIGRTHSWPRSAFEE